MRRLGWTLVTLTSHWRRHPLQFATLMIGLIAATALWSGVQAINAQARHSYDRAAATFGGGRVAMLTPTQSETLPQTLFATLRRAGWPVSPVLEGPVTVGGVGLRLIGIEPLTLPRAAGPAVPGLGSDDLAAFLLPPGRTLIAPDTLRQLAAHAGDAPVLGDGMRLPPLATRPDLVPGTAVVDIGVAQHLLHQPGRISRLLVGDADGPRAPLAEVAGDTLRLVAAGGESDLERLTDSFHVNLTAFGLLSFVVGLFIVYSAIGLAFEQRLPMMRAMRACGVSGRGLTVALLVELVGVALVAGVIGCACGYLIAALLLPDVALSLRGLYGAEVPGELTLQPIWWLAGIGMSAAGALAAAAHSLIKARRLPLIATAHPDAWRTAEQRWLIWQGVAALVLAAMALGLVVFADSLIAGFALLATIMLAAALALPLVLVASLHLGARGARDTLVRWAFADSRQQLSGLSLALMALLLALAVNIGVGTMVRSFEQSFTGWLDQRLASDIYIRAADGNEARAIRAFLATRRDVTAVLPTPRAETRLKGGPVEVLGFADHPTYRDHWPLIAATPTLWDDLRDGRAALVSEQLARRLALAPGDRLTLATPAGALTLQVGGIYPDYGNPKGQIGLGNAVLFAHWRDTPDTRFSLRVAAGAAPALMTALRGRFALDPAHLIDQAALKHQSLAIFNRTFAVTASLNTFTLGVAGVALLTSLLTLGASRLPQLAPLWAMGVTRRRLAALDLAKTMALAFLTALAAIPLGLVVAWCLLAIVNVKAFGWRLPFHVFPGQLAQLIVVALGAALLAALWPTLRLARMKPADLIRVFANER
jgi:putative ABC transport system permease protein